MTNPGSPKWFTGEDSRDPLCPPHSWQERAEPIPGRPVPPDPAPPWLWSTHLFYRRPVSCVGENTGVPEVAGGNGAFI
jgi:hypothetical protein